MAILNRKDKFGFVPGERTENDNFTKGGSEIPDENDDGEGNENEEENGQQSSSSPQQIITALDCFEFTWNVTHSLRPYYNKLKKKMYAKYDCDESDNIDLQVLVDQVLVLSTQLYGVGKMTRDGEGPKNLSYRVKEHQKILRETMLSLMKYTRKEPEKSLKKTTISKGKELASSMKDKMSDTERSLIAKAIRDTIVNRRTSVNEDSKAPFGEDDE